MEFINFYLGLGRLGLGKFLSLIFGFDNPQANRILLIAMSSS